MKKRLDGLVNFVEEGKIVADIGSDHGITAIKIFEEKRPRKVIATDISENSLEKLREKLRNNPNLDIETKVTDGIEDLKDYGLENIIISGMGGYLIADIIKEGLDVARGCERLILQANNSLEHLRRFLRSKDFSILDEVMVYEEGKYYTIILASPLGPKEDYSPLDYKYGKKLKEKKDPVFIDYLDFRLRELGLIYENIKNIDTRAANLRRKKLLEEEKEIGGLKACL